MVTTAQDVYDWFASRDDAWEPDRTPLKLLKLTYFAFGHFLDATGDELFDDQLLAFKDGPVIYDLWKRHHGERTPVREAYDVVPPAIDDPEVAEILEQVNDMYGKYSATQLRRLSHDAAWEAARSRSNEGKSQTMRHHEIRLAFRKLHGRREALSTHTVMVEPDALEAMDDVDIDDVVRELTTASAI